MLLFISVLLFIYEPGQFGICDVRLVSSVKLVSPQYILYTSSTSPSSSSSVDGNSQNLQQKPHINSRWRESRKVWALRSYQVAHFLCTTWSAGGWTCLPAASPWHPASKSRHRRRQVCKSCPIWPLPLKKRCQSSCCISPEVLWGVRVIN